MNVTFAVFLRQRQHFVLDELGVLAGHGVVFEAPLARPEVAAVGDEDAGHHRQALLGDEVVHHHDQLRLDHRVRAAVVIHHQRQCGARRVSRRHVDPDVALVRAAHAGVHLRVFRLHGEHRHGALRDGVRRRHGRHIGPRRRRRNLEIAGLVSGGYFSTATASAGGATTNAGSCGPRPPRGAPPAGAAPCGPPGAAEPAGGLGACTCGAASSPAAKAQTTAAPFTLQRTRQ